MDPYCRVSEENSVARSGPIIRQAYLMQHTKRKLLIVANHSLHDTDIRCVSADKHMSLWFPLGFVQSTSDSVKDLSTGLHPWLGYTTRVHSGRGSVRHRVESHRHSQQADVCGKDLIFVPLIFYTLYTFVFISYLIWHQGYRKRNLLNYSRWLKMFFEVVFLYIIAASDIAVPFTYQFVVWFLFSLFDQCAHNMQLPQPKDMFEVVPQNVPRLCPPPFIPRGILDCTRNKECSNVTCTCDLYNHTKFM